MVTDNVCKCCGQTLPPLAPFGLRLTRGESRIFERVARAGPHGVEIDALADWVWADDPGGGPENVRKILHVRIYYLNRKLRAKGKEISCGGRGYIGYVLRDAGTKSAFLYTRRHSGQELRA